MTFFSLCYNYNQFENRFDVVVCENYLENFELRTW